MTRVILPLLLFVLGAGLVHGGSDEETAAHSAAYEVAGAFSNDGFKLRDGFWAGSLQPGKIRIVQVNLYAGNQYWFAAGSEKRDAKLSLTVYDEAGNALASESYADDGKAVAGFSPTISGPYYVRVRGEENTLCSFCLLYAYK